MNRSPLLIGLATVGSAEDLADNSEIGLHRSASYSSAAMHRECGTNKPN